MSEGCILVIGGAGFVGSHTVVEFVNAGYEVVVLDNFSHASRECVRRVEEICGTTIETCDVDITNTKALKNVFDKHSFSTVIHTAGLKGVSESLNTPLTYYRVNVAATLELIQIMKEHKVYNLIFSSSAAVYGSPKYLPLDENHKTGECTTPYGRTKCTVEELLKDMCKVEPEWNVIIFRYFNIAGAHKAGKIGENLSQSPGSLMSYCAEVAIGKRSVVSVYGDDHDTPDGTAIRDYVHVVDLAAAHVAAQKKIAEGCGLKIYNLGSGCGYSVMEIIKAMSKASGKNVPYKVVGKRKGDVEAFYANVDLAAEELGWQAQKGLDEICEDLWRLQTSFTDGFSNNTCILT